MVSSVRGHGANCAGIIGAVVKPEPVNVARKSSWASNHTPLLSVATLRADVQREIYPKWLSGLTRKNGSARSAKDGPQSSSPMGQVQTEFDALIKLLANLLYPHELTFGSLTPFARAGLAPWNAAVTTLRDMKRAPSVAC